MTADMKAARERAHAVLTHPTMYGDYAQNLAAAFLEVESDLAALRELHNIHNLGGMTDYNDRPMKRALAAESALEAERPARAEADQSANKWYAQAMTQSSAAEQRAAELQRRLEEIQKVWDGTNDVETIILRLRPLMDRALSAQPNAAAEAGGTYQPGQKSASEGSPPSAAHVCHNTFGNLCDECGKDMSSDPDPALPGLELAAKICDGWYNMTDARREIRSEIIRRKK